MFLNNICAYIFQFIIEYNKLKNCLNGLKMCAYLPLYKINQFDLIITKIEKQILLSIYYNTFMYFTFTMKSHLKALSF